MDLSQHTSGGVELSPHTSGVVANGTTVVVEFTVVVGPSVAITANYLVMN